jgi:hypothetical protein
MERELNNLIKPRFMRLSDPDSSALEVIVAALNGENEMLTPEQRSALVNFVELWNQSGRNPLRRPFASEFLSKRKRFSFNNLATTWRLRLVPESAPAPDAGGAAWFMHPDSNDAAALLAVALLTHPLRSKVSDRPCQRTACRRWFIKKRNGQLTCSRQCRDVVRAADQNEREREDKHEKKLELVRDWISEWEKATDREKRRYGNWKEFIVWKTKKEVSKQFITRAVTNKELKAPKGGKGK